MNCFQKLLSSWWRTAYFKKITPTAPLWIAFKNYYLRDEGQLREKILVSLVGCELLSKIIIFVMKDSSGNNISIDAQVVNCFQKLLSSWWRTANSCLWIFGNPLWIAFKNYYLRDEGQQIWFIKNSKPGCELLSKIIIFVMKDSLQM